MLECDIAGPKPVAPPPAGQVHDNVSAAVELWAMIVSDLGKSPRRVRRSASPAARADVDKAAVAVAIVLDDHFFARVPVALKCAAAVEFKAHDRLTTQLVDVVDELARAGAPVRAHLCLNRLVEPPGWPLPGDSLDLDGRSNAITFSRQRAARQAAGKDCSQRYGNRN